MAGEIKSLKFADGTTYTAAPGTFFISMTGLHTYANDAAYVSAKGSGAAAGDAYYNTTLKTIRYYTTSWYNATMVRETTAPTANEDSGDGYQVGDLWINSSTDTLYICVDNTSTAAVWRTLSINESSETISGTKSFSAITTISNTTQSTTKDDGALIVEGGVGIEKNLNVGGDAVITGNLTVNGTSTTLNTTTLDIEDVNITLNKNGNQTSADDLAGITIEMSDATHAKILYDKDATSRFKCGDAASEKEIATISDSQTFTNKKLSDSTTEIVDVSDPTKKIKFDAAGTTGTATTILSSQTTDKTITLPNATTTLVGTDATQTLTLKTFDDEITLKQISTPSNPASGYNKIYFKNDDKPYYKTNGGVEKAVGSGGGGGSSLIWKLNWTDSPLENTGESVYLDTLDFPYENITGITALLTVPSSYSAGNQIKLKNGSFYTAATTNKVLFQAVTYLIEDGSTVAGTYSNSHTSTNAEVTVSGVASTVTAIGDIDLSSNTGTINSVAIAPGDKLLIVLKRKVDSETSSATNYATLLRDSFTPTFE